MKENQKFALVISFYEKKYQHFKQKYQHSKKSEYSDLNRFWHKKRNITNKRSYHPTETL